MKLLPLYLILAVLVPTSSHPTRAQEVIHLYEGAAPGSESWTWQEAQQAFEGSTQRFAYNVVDPTLTVFLPERERAIGAAVIVAPGGAFHILSVDHEGYDVARWLNERGVAAFVLKYRLVRSLTDRPLEELAVKMQDFDRLDEVNAPVVPLATDDGHAAVRWVRAHAGEWGIDPDRIGFMGFSAGGTLTMSVLYTADEASRPNFVAPIYAYERAILGSEVPTARTPIFLAAASDDPLGLAPHSVAIYQKWLEAGQPTELHMYERGGHGFGMRTQGLPSDQWIEAFDRWLGTQGLLARRR
jgi:acetyl esterase/lipase